MTRDSLAFIGWSLPALDDGFGRSRSILLRGPRVLRNTKTDQTHGRSVALLAPLHPKCPFQVELLRVRASYCCFLVLGYYEVPGLYGYRTKPVNTAPYLSLDRLERWWLNPELLPDGGLRSAQYCSAAAAWAPLARYSRSSETSTVLGARVDVQHAPRQVDPPVEVPSTRCRRCDGAFHDFEDRKRGASRGYGWRPFLVFEVQVQIARCTDWTAVRPGPALGSWLMPRIV